MNAQHTISQSITRRALTVLALILSTLVSFGSQGPVANAAALQDTIEAPKITLEEYSSTTPALAVFNNRLYTAWAGRDAENRINIMMSPPNPASYVKFTLEEYSSTAPALVVFNNRLYLAWTGKDYDRRLNLLSSTDGVSFSNKVLFAESSYGAPALAVFGNRLYIAWTGMDYRINLMSSTDGRQFGNKVTLEDFSYGSPALTVFNNQLYLAWTGIDRMLNVMRSTGGAPFQNKVMLRESSIGVPALTIWTGTDGLTRLWLAWTGTDSPTYSINLMSSLDGQNFGNKIFRESSLYGPALLGGSPGAYISRLYLAWTGKDSEQRLNYLVF